MFRESQNWEQKRRSARRQMSVSRNSFRLAATLLLLGCAFSCRASFADECKPLSPLSRKAIVSYLSKRLKILDTTFLRLGKEEFVRDTCYRKLTLEGGSLTQPLTFFLSPDQRFVSPLMLDTALDPELEEQEEAERTNKLLLPDASPSRGDAGAPIRIVEFSDFECPYSRRFNEWIETLPSETKAQIRLAYKHFPLAIHPWANDAAALSTCASLQSPSAFWLLHDFIFKEQGSLNPTNIRHRVVAFAANTPVIDADQLVACFDEHQADGIIKRDRELAIELHISVTPMIFVNGARVSPLRSIDDLKAAITHASEALARGSTSTESARPVR